MESDVRIEVKDGGTFLSANGPAERAIDEAKIAHVNNSDKVDIFSNISIATSCAGQDPLKSKQPDLSLERLYKKSALIGIFEVIRAGPELQGHFAGDTTMNLVLKTLQIFKGDATADLQFEHIGINNGLSADYKLGEKYLLAFNYAPHANKLKDGPVREHSESNLKMQKSMYQNLKNL